MICDVCNAKVSEGKGTRIPAPELQRLLDGGFGLNPTNVKMLESAGSTREPTENMLSSSTGNPMRTGYSA